MKMTTVTSIVLVLITMLALGYAPSTLWGREAPLTNEVILELHRAGLSDDVIIGKIRNSSADFNISPDALIQLRRAGISNQVILVMVGKSSGGKGGSAGTSEILPSSYGAYVVKGGGICLPSPRHGE